MTGAQLEEAFQQAGFAVSQGSDCVLSAFHLAVHFDGCFVSSTRLNQGDCDRMVAAMGPDMFLKMRLVEMARSILCSPLQKASISDIRAMLQDNARERREWAKAHPGYRSMGALSQTAMNLKGRS